MSWNNVIPASAFNPPAESAAPKSTRGRKPSKWQLEGNDGVSDGTGSNIWFDCPKKAKAALAYARAFGYIPDDPRNV